MFCWIGISTAIINNPHKDLINSSGMIGHNLLRPIRSLKVAAAADIRSLDPDEEERRFSSWRAVRFLCLGAVIVVQ